MEIFPVIAALELESLWLLIGFFVFVALCAAAAMLLLLRQHNYGLPPNSTQAIMLVMLLITLLVSLLVATGLYRITEQTDSGKDEDRNSEQLQWHHPRPDQNSIPETEAE
ncbi:MAG: hypothetical protein LAT75_08690 [Candidatus Cyclonatronum sp.]|uniref:hypothetical protein n=1 Tax=Cyclonatronum sp. TaxID=3024185 RepID=UPI0025B9E643|nr:hypothetical protein [Cyclonatronum sp.]MCC5934471.1 hypothetical protein [Balneolales bacterium]MCH8486930.1 hypothetical protein [Cyclonatronum sp.]